ncbi:MAG: tryptophan 7-halogenase [Gemmatimonadaceae bacterium]|nr:tryptophan 7-halogenase [Acetobacteraceae bacterium]
MTEIDMTGQTHDCDVLIIGGGPAGSTAAALLAERGRDVVMLEKAVHPRFHIGESLLPRNSAIFDKLGLRDNVASIGVHKPGAEFVHDDTGRSVHFAFALGLDKKYTTSWQVRRADFDELLFRNAESKGARTEEGTRVTEVQFAPPGGRAQVTAVGPDGVTRRYTPRFVLDASGRDTFLAGKMKSKDSNKFNSTAALYAHFNNVERRTGELEGFITVHLVDDGWFWMIPLPDNVMSVGFVGNQSAFKGRKGTPHDLFMERINRAPTVRARMRDAELVGDVTSTGNYSYRSATGHGEGYMMIGDAFGFVDPMFSSGVLLAMTAGDLGADVADAWLDSPAAGRAKAKRVERDLKHGMQRFGWLIYRINTPALRFLFLNPRNELRMRDGLVSLLAGNLRGNRKSFIPVLAFKSAYYLTSFLMRMGLQPRQPLAPLPQLAPAE